MSSSTNARAGPPPSSASSSMFPLRLRPGNVSRRRSRSFSGWSPSQQHPKPLPPPTKDDLLMTPNQRTTTSASASAKQAKLSIYPASGGKPTPAPTTSMPLRQRLASFSKLRIPLPSPSATGPAQFIYRPFKSKQDVRSPNTATEIEGRTSGFTPRPSGESEYAATIHGDDDEPIEPPLLTPDIMDLPSPTSDPTNGMKRFVKGLKGIPAMLSPKSPSFRRVTHFVKGDREKQRANVPVLPPTEEKPIDPNLLRFSYDRATRRVTGLENWRNFFPTNSSDPFQNHQISEQPFTGDESQKQNFEKSALLGKIGQKLAELMGSTAGARVPASFTLEVTTPEDLVFPSSEEAPISPPFNVTHNVSVTTDPVTGRLVGMPKEWSNGNQGLGASGRRHNQSVIVSEVISASSLSRYLKPAPVPDTIHSPPEERVSYVPISEPAVAQEVVTTPLPAYSTPDSAIKPVAVHRKPVPVLSPSERKPNPMISPSERKPNPKLSPSERKPNQILSPSERKPSGAPSSRHKRTPSHQPNPSPPAVRTRTRSVTVSGEMLQRLNKPLPPIPTDRD